MFIEDGWEFEDHVSGLKLKVTNGGSQDVLHIERIGEPIVDNRDFFFTKDGKLDGTGSGCC